MGAAAGVDIRVSVLALTVDAHSPRRGWGDAGNGAVVPAAVVAFFGMSAARFALY